LPERSEFPLLPEFNSVYDHIYGFGRTKSVSYRIWNGARKSELTLLAPEGVSPKKLKRRFREAVRKLKSLRGL
jgi:hypothetical protein